MSYKKIILGYPTVSNFLNFVKNRGYVKKDELTGCLIDYFNSSASVVRPNINITDFNVLVLNTASKQISGDVNNILAEYESKMGEIRKQVKIYTIEHTYPMEVIGRFPHVLSLLDKDMAGGKFDLVICQCELLNNSIMPHLKDFIKDDGLLICDKKFKLNTDDVQGWIKVNLSEKFHTFQPVMSNRSDLTFDINSSDIPLGDFLKYQSSVNFEVVRIDEHVKNFILNYVERSGHRIRLERESTNILVMCSTTPSINRRKFYTIMQRSIGDNGISIKDCNIYHIGKDIYREYGNVFRGTIERFEVINNCKFDIIISEHCPTVSLMSSIGHIRRLLKDAGVLITPVTSFERNLPSGFEEVKSSSEDYMILWKEQSDPADTSNISPVLSSRTDNTHNSDYESFDYKRASSKFDSVKKGRDESKDEECKHCDGESDTDEESFGSYDEGDLERVTNRVNISGRRGAVSGRDSYTMY